MERQFQCPSCGASNTVTNPGVLMRICDYCKTAIYWDKESALRAGEKSVDLPDSPRFKVGATGKIKGRSFRVLGRIHYAHEKGTWNEWFVEMENGEIMWLTEDERELFLESPMKLTSPVPPHSELTPGMRIKLNGKEGVIEEIGEAKCLGGEGRNTVPGGNRQSIPICGRLHARWKLFFRIGIRSGIRKCHGLFRPDH